MAPKHKHVKEVITCLCQLLDPNNSRKICPEIFRLAKFDNKNALDCLQKLLSELLVFLKTGTYNDKSFRLVHQFRADEIEKFIDIQLSLLLSPVCRTFVSSRTLLLNICWLISEKNILEELVLNQSVRLGEDISCLSQERNSVITTKFTATSLVDPIAKLNALRWLYGLVVAKLKILNTMTSQKGKLFDRIHTITRGAGFSRDRDHLSMLEVYLLRHPDQMDELLHRLDNDNSLLELLVFFKNHEHIFWKWIDSVLDEHERDTPVCNKDVCQSEVLHEKLKRFTSTQSELQSFISRHEDVIDALDICIEREEASLDPCEKETSLRKVETRLSRDLAKVSHQQFLATHYKGLFSRNQVKSLSPPIDKNRNYVGQTSPEKSDPFEMYFEVENLIGKLEKEIENLDVEINDMRCQYYDLMSFG